MIKPRKLLFLILTVISVCIVFAVSASADNGEICYGAATVSATQLNIRSGPSTEKTILGTANDKAILVIIEKTNDDWYRVNYNGTVGYVKTDYLTNILTAENFSATGSISKTDVRLRKTFNAESDILATFQPGKSVEVIGINTGWYKVVADGNTGYIRSDLMEIVGPGPNSPAPVVKSLGRQIADYALQFEGYRYIYGEESPSTGFDCSGLVWYVYRQFGYTVERTASAQYRTAGYSVSKSELQPGDLVFFSNNGGYSVTHVGIYIGDNEFVHASTSDTGVIISSLGSDYYTRVWYGAKRVV